MTVLTLSGCLFVWETLHATPGTVQKCYQLIRGRIVVGVAFCLLGKNLVQSGTVEVQASKEAERSHLRLLLYCWLISFLSAFSDCHPYLKLPGV